MEITYRWKDTRGAESAASSIAWNMPHVGMPEIVRRGRRITFRTQYEYTMNQVKHYALKCGGKECKKRQKKVLDLI